MSNKLDFLSEVLNFDDDNKSLLFPFFKSKFIDNRWIFLFNGNNETVIDFNIKLSNGDLLTNKKHYKKLNTLKDWIIESIYENNTYMNSSKGIKGKLYSILNIFDYINFTDNGSFAKYGFEGLDADYWISLLTQYVSNNNFGSKINIDKLILEFYNKHQSTNYERLENLNIDELKAIRNFFKKNKVNLHALTPNMLVKRTSFPYLLQQDKKGMFTEFDSYFRESEENTLSETTLYSYIKCLKTLCSFIGNKSANNYSIPNIKDLEKALSLNYNTAMKKRFETYPSQHIFKILEQAIEFHYSYGEQIISTCVEHINNKEKISNIRFDKDFFIRLRANESNYHLLKIYYGSVQFILGTLMARRQSELLNLKAFECLDESEKFLVFNRAKNTKGLFGIRGVYRLPIDKLVVDMIKNIERIHKACNSKSFLFNVPNAVNHALPISADKSEYNNHLDLFFDYIEAPVIDEKRLYVRQHQLRRFFAMSFFWGSGIGSLDTLRWFLGHTDVKHVYNYITESVSGEVLKSVKSQYIAENIYKYDDLLSLIKSRYHTQNLDLLDTNSLMEYIDDMLEQNLIEIEPEFLIDNKDNKYQIIVKLKDK